MKKHARRLIDALPSRRRTRKLLDAIAHLERERDHARHDRNALGHLNVDRQHTIARLNRETQDAKRERDWAHDELERMRDAANRWRDACNAVAKKYAEQRAATRPESAQLAYLEQRFRGDATDARLLATTTDRTRDYWHGRAAGLDAAAHLTATAQRRHATDWTA